MLRFHAIGDWGERDVTAEWSPVSTRRSVPEIDAHIEVAWQEATHRPGVHLFDGPMCRLESWVVEGSALRLRFSPTSYKVFLGTNLTHPELADRFGSEVMANPIGVSALIETSDNVLLLGRRNASVAYYPSRVHPFAGAIEPRDGVHPFDAVRRELHEELKLNARGISELRCIGLVEDRALRQPELIFHVRSALKATAIEGQLDREEHHAAFRINADAQGVDSALRSSELTPVAAGSLLLRGRSHFGRKWFDEHAARFA